MYSVLGMEMKNSAYGEPNPPFFDQCLCLLHSFLVLSLAVSVSFLVHMEERGCQLLPNFTCYSPDKQTEIDVGLLGGVAEFPGNGLSGPPRVRCPLCDCGQKWGHGTGQLLLAEERSELRGRFERSAVRWSAFQQVPTWLCGRGCPPCSCLLCQQQMNHEH